jgi:tetratricopeptide (TPR) repeat protein
LNQTVATRQETDRSGTWISLFILTVFTLLTFVNSWPDALVFDDKIFLGPESEHRLERFGDAFSRKLWNQESGLYRPLLSIDFELQNRLFGSWREGYHLVNILLHLITTLTLFGFLRYFFRLTRPRDRNVPFYALTAALVFAVHPMHTEVVNSVFNKSSMYVSLAAVAGLWWLLSNLEKRPAGAWIGFGMIYSAAILFKESALVLPGIAVAMIVLFTHGSLKERVLRFLPVFWLLIPIAAYFWARAAAQVTGGTDTAGGSNDLSFLMDETQWVVNQSWIQGIGQFGHGLKLLLWPYPNRLYYGALDDIELFAYISMQAVLGGWAIYLWAKGRPMLAFSLIFYYLALFPSIRIISLQDELPHIAERYLYFPSVGLAFALAAGLQKLSDTLERKHLMIIFLPVILALAAISWERNADWNSAAQLFETEYQSGSRGEDALRVLIAAHYNEGRYDRVAEICDDNPSKFTKSYGFATACMSSYLNLRRTDDAIAAIEAHARDGDDWLKARLAAASLYKARKQYQQVVEQYAAIIERVDDPASKALYKGEMLMMVFPDDREQLEVARSLLQQALALNPELTMADKRLKQIDQRITEFDAQSSVPDPRQE